MRYFCSLLSFPTTAMSWNLSVLWLSFLIHSPLSLGFNRRVEGKKDGNLCLFLFQPLPSRVHPKKGCLCLPQVTAPVKILRKQPAVSTYHYQPLHSLTIPTTPSVMGMVAVPSHSAQDYRSIFFFYLPSSLTTSL